MLKSVRNCLFGFFGHLLSKIKPKKTKEQHNSTIHAHQEASLGFLLNMYNNINLYNIKLEPKYKEMKISELEEMKKQLETYIHNGEINGAEEFGQFR